VTAACAGKYSGTFDGDLSGAMTGSLDAAGKFTFSFGGEALGEGSGTVDPDLTVSGEAHIPTTNVVTATLDGAFDAGQCRLSGGWESLAGDSGGYEFHRTG